MGKQNTAADPFFGGGEMGERIRSTDWGRTRLGPDDGWPQSLKTAVSLILHSRYPMFVWWGEQLINIYNDGYIPVLGARHPAALGQPAPEIWHEIWDAVGPLAETVLKKGQSTWNEKLLLDMERYGYPEETYFTFSYSPVLDDGGNIGGLFCACFEDTQQVVGERRLRGLRQLSNLTADASTAVEACELTARVIEEHPLDIAFGLVYLFEESGKRLRLAGHSRLAPGSPGAPEMLERESSGGAARFWPVEAAFRGEKAVLSDLGTREKLPGGAWPEPASSAMVLPFGKSGPGTPTGILVLGASPRRPFDEDYQAYFELFADGAESAVSNASAYEEERRRAELLAELDRAKTAFFSNVSHEFRTPLTLMLGPLGDLLSKPEGGVLPENRPHLQVVHRNGQRLLKLVNTLLDFSRIEAGRIRASYEPVDLPALTTDLASVFRSAVEKAGMRFTIDCPPLPEPVYVDRDMWEKVVLNLLSNAFKYTLEGEIAITLAARDGAAVLSVRDTGTGIPKAEMPKLFDRFYRVEGARGRTHEGSGIGLALVRELAKLHGGEVAVESVEGSGSTFSVGIPFGKDHLPADHIAAARKDTPPAGGAVAFVEEALRWLPEQGATAHETVVTTLPGEHAPERLASAGRPAKVIVADDNADMRDYVRRLLAQRYTVIAAADGEQALRAAHELNPDLIVTDVMMPNLDGFGLLKALRRDPKTASIPVVMLSARAGEEAMVEALRAGVDDYLVKPFSARELLARVSGLLALARTRREAEQREQELLAETAKVLESIPQGYCAFDRDFRFTYANPEAERILEQGNQELLGKTLWEVFPAGDEVETRLRRAMTEHTPLQFENYYGPWGRWFEIGAYPTGDGGLAVYFRDISSHKAAEEAKDRFAFLAENSTDFIGICDKDFQPTYVNRAGLELVGLDSSEEAQRTPVPEFFFPEDRAFITETFLPQVLRDGHGEVEIRFRHFRTGEAIWMTYNVVVLKDQAGNLTGLASISRNVSERKQTEAALRVSEEQFRTLANSIPQLAWMARPDGYIFWYNQRWYDYTGMALEQVEGWGWQAVHDPVELPRVVEKFKHCIATRTPWEDTFSLRRHDGEMRWHLSRMTALHDEHGEVVLWFGTNTDITERREMEQALREADRRKDEFLAMLGHELRNPLAAISGGMNLLESDPTPEHRAWIDQMMARQVRQLGRLVDDLLDVTRITQGKIQLRKQRIELRERFDAATEAVRELIRERNHELETELPREPIYLIADPARLDQILTNLLTNAAKYTPTGGRIELSARVEGEEAVIRCKDNGIGMSPDVLESVFKPFVQLNPSLDRTGSGLGMGLNLVRTLAQMHGGSVAAASDGPGQGSVFALRLPLAAEGEGSLPVRAEAAAAGGEQGGSLQILIVDDNRDLAESTAILLRNAGHSVTVACDGQTALEIADREHPEIVLMDLGMPGLNGYEVAERMRKRPDLARAKLVAVSGYPPAKKRQEGAPLFDAHLVKPVDYGQLQRLIRELPESGPATAPQPDAPKRILIVEDNRELALLTAELLTNRGQDVRVAFTGAEALEEASRFRPHVVFCDLHLPDQSGFEVAQRLREEASLQPLALIGITADHAQVYESEVEATPFDQFLSKPLAWPKIQEILRSVKGTPASSQAS